MGEVIAFPTRPRVDRGARAAELQHLTRPNVAPDVLSAGPPVHDPAPTPPAADVARGRSSAGDHEPLWREVSGAVLREERLRQRRTLAQTADRAGMSVQYLSELERGRKEASSEMLAAACGSLGLSLGEFARRCAARFASVAARPFGPVLMAS